MACIALLINRCCLQVQQKKEYYGPYFAITSPMHIKPLEVEILSQTPVAGLGGEQKAEHALYTFYYLNKDF
jgi:hypothetical protein